MNLAEQVLVHFFIHVKLEKSTSSVALQKLQVSMVLKKTLKHAISLELGHEIVQIRAQNWPHPELVVNGPHIA